MDPPSSLDAWACGLSFGNIYLAQGDMKTTTTLFYIAAAMTIVGIMMAFADLSRHKVKRSVQQPVVITVVSPTPAATQAAS